VAWPWGSVAHESQLDILAPWPGGPVSSTSSLLGPGGHHTLCWLGCGEQRAPGRASTRAARLLQLCPPELRDHELLLTSAVPAAAAVGAPLSTCAQQLPHHVLRVCLVAPLWGPGAARSGSCACACWIAAATWCLVHSAGGVHTVGSAAAVGTSLLWPHPLRWMQPMAAQADERDREQGGRGDQVGAAPAASCQAC